MIRYPPLFPLRASELRALTLNTACLTPVIRSPDASPPTSERDSTIGSMSARMCGYFLASCRRLRLNSGVKTTGSGSRAMDPLPEVLDRGDLPCLRFAPALAKTIGRRLEVDTFAIGAYELEQKRQVFLRYCIDLGNDLLAIG